MPKEISYIWSAQQKAKDCEMIECKEYDPYNDFKRDSSGYYVLIKPDFSTYRIEVAICNKKHEVIKIFSGRKPQDLYYAIFKFEKKHNITWFKDKDHIAYLGKELKKCEIALATGNNAYFQE